MPVDPRVLGPRSDGAVDPVGAAAEHDHDVAGHLLVENADRLLCLLDRGKRLGLGPGVGVASGGRHVKRLLDGLGRERQGTRKEYCKKTKRSVLQGHDILL